MQNPRSGIIYFVISFLLSCGSSGKDPVSPDDNSRVGELRDRYGAALIEAMEYRDSHGWLTSEDCDAMLWTGKYASATLVESVDILAAEYPDQPGRFARRPLTNPCTSDNPQWSTWSRDMGTGLMAWALRKNQLPVLERHAGYGAGHFWNMGEPLGDGRAVYTPSFKGKLYQTIYALGGKDDINRLWPDFYPAGLTDYQAHLQVMNIWQRGEITKRVPSSDDAHHGPPVIDDPSGPATGLTEISGTMIERLKEHADRDPRDPLFQAVLSLYTGVTAPAYEALLSSNDYAGEYVRCERQRACYLAAWIFAADIVLRHADAFKPSELRTYDGR